jgi:CheY-like chemotaxis protein
VKLQTCITPQPLLVEADATQLQQVVMNLCTNAWQALPEGRGRIEVGLALQEAQSGVAEGGTPTGAPTGARAHLWVADSGSGMAPELLERIFDPFFTTKPVGQGTGLGLSVVHGIVRSLRGHVSVSSTPGEGSRFDVWLPLALGEDVAAPPPGDGEPVPTGHGERLLYVDDDAVMGLVVQRLLEREGYAVTVQASPVQALACVRDAPRVFDLVISDFNMPEMSGTELAAQLRALRPELPVVISSGYVSDTLREQAAALGVRALLHKEQTLEALPALVRQVLAKPA